MEKSKIAMMVEEETKNLHKLAEKLEEVVKYEFDKGVENVDTKEMSEVIDMLKDIYEAKEKIVKACYYKQIMEAMEEADFEDEEDIMDYGRRGYRGQRRDSQGRFMSNRGRRSDRRGYFENEQMMPNYEMPIMYYTEPPYNRMTPRMYRDNSMEELRDMDRSAGKMYYSSGNMTTTSNMGDGSSSGNMGGSSSSRNYGGQNESRSERARRNYTESKQMHKSDTPEDKQAKMKDLEEYMKELGADLGELVGEMDASEKALMKNKLQVLLTKIQ